ncbi:MAG: hypothetical protein ACK4HF_16310, partial [Paracoccaceae bacterium]
SSESQLKPQGNRRSKEEALPNLHTHTGTALQGCCQGKLPQESDCAQAQSHADTSFAPGQPPDDLRDPHKRDDAE